MLLGGRLGYNLLRFINTGQTLQGSAEPRLSYVPKIKRLIGERGWNELCAKVVVDFGCGIGVGALEMAQHGAKHVVGIDIRPQVLDDARRAAQAAGLERSCTFAEFAPARTKADVIVSIDAFEHFEDPAGVLRAMNGLLRDNGCVLVSFGPTWYHPRGGHLFSVFPWSHLVFTEAAQVRWRADFKHDGARHFHEVEGGLNQMTIRRFLDLVRDSDFGIETLKIVPIRPLRWLHNRLTREFTSAVVECKLVKRRRSEVRERNANPLRELAPLWDAA
jgi:SAM-dependent methyltransferase